MSEHSQLISTAALRSELGNSSLKIIDCRFDLGNPQAGRRAYLDGHIPTAVYADMDRDLAAPITEETGRHPLPDVEGFAATLGGYGIDGSSSVVVYDDASGAFAARAWWLLRWLGHTDVRLLDGGIKQWVAQELPLRVGHESVAAADFVARPSQDKVVTTIDLVDNLDRIGSMNLVDARDAARFRGELEPVDPVAGHVPGAINLPFTESLNANGTFKSRGDLQALWCRVLGQDRTVPWVAMCGSGVTACHLAISATEAGFREPRLYVGSWSEWIRDSRRPVGLGQDGNSGANAADLA